MVMRAMKPCAWPCCPNLVRGQTYCEEHTKQTQRNQDQRRGTAHERGYTYRWSKYSKWFLSQSDNIFCRLQLPGCTNLAQCVDHIQAPNGSGDPLFWERGNHQAACIHCNSKKGRNVMKGESGPFSNI